MKTEKKHKLNIFEVLGNISKKNPDYYNTLTEEEQKALMPLVVMRWLTGTNDARQIYFLNELVNPFVFSLANHKELLVDLMTTCCSGSSRRYNWKRVQSKKTTKSPTVVGVIRDHFGYSTIDAVDALPLLADSDIMEYAEHLGRQPDDIKKIKKELKTRAK